MHISPKIVVPSEPQQPGPRPPVTGGTTPNSLDYPHVWAIGLTFVLFGWLLEHNNYDWGLALTIALIALLGTVVIVKGSGAAVSRMVRRITGDNPSGGQGAS